MKGIVTLGLLLAFASSDSATDESLRKAKRTIPDMRTLGAVMESYAEDHHAYPGVATIKELEPIAVPRYITALLTTDPWGTEYRYLVTPDRRHYRIVSAGADGLFDKRYEPMGSEPPAKLASDNFDDDIVYEDGQFRRVPSALKRALEFEDYRAPKF